MFFHYWEKLAFKRAAAFIVPSNAMKEHLGSCFGIKDKISVIAHGVDSDLFNPEKKTFEKKGYNVTFVGRLVSRKGLITLFKALELLKARDLKIAFCGGNAKEIDAHISKLRQKTRHTFYLIGPISYCLMPTLYLDSDMVVRL